MKNNTLRRLYKNLALKYGCRYIIDYPTGTISINIENCKKPQKLVNELRKLQLLEQGRYI
jgi:predicted Ser/Thr protein kinase